MIDEQSHSQSSNVNGIDDKLKLKIPIIKMKVNQGEREEVRMNRMEDALNVAIAAKVICPNQH